MKNEKEIIIFLIIMCGAGIMSSIGNLFQSKHIEQLEKRVNEIYFTEDYLDFVKAEGRK